MENRLAEFRKMAGLTQIQLADMVGTSKLQISRLERGERQLTPKWMSRLAPYLNCQPEELISSQTGILRQAPLISWVQAGAFTECFDPYVKGDYAELVNTSHRKPTVIALKVVGNSMDRFAPDGSIIIVDYGDKDLRDSRLYVVRLNGDDETTFKRYRADPPRLEPYSYGDYETIFPDGDMEVVGRVVEMHLKAPE